MATTELPKNAEKLDATKELIGRTLKAGDTELKTKSSSGLGLVVHAAPGKLLTYSIVDSAGKPVPTEDVQTVVADKPVCWRCGVDKGGTTNCWVIPCRVIVGPWVPGKVIGSEEALP